MPQVFVGQTILIAALTLPSSIEAMPTLPLASKCCHLALPPWDTIILASFRFPKSNAGAPTITSYIKKSDHGAPLTNLFLTDVVKGVSSGPSHGEGAGLK